ncbi:hypothetical protein EJ08DRAFT_372861 [Tothia fuscella]|uniref:Uncharacterized protein n=1 Tax=Tothia fuscella TaxID=1048955 RepID=A0A9P4NLH3_9PEZI|nr:hypothetical protein EJ08DRAFT_372861 [Tothia fuscella]
MASILRILYEHFLYLWISFAVYVAYSMLQEALTNIQIPMRFPITISILSKFNGADVNNSLEVCCRTCGSSAIL